MAKKTSDPADWLNDIHASIGKYISLETVDGVVREGRLSGVRLNAVKFNGVEQHSIIELEMNGDPTDCVEFYRVAKLDIPDL
jgi:hypothetical protein